MLRLSQGRDNASGHSADFSNTLQDHDNSDARHLKTDVKCSNSCDDVANMLCNHLLYHAVLANN
jgi:hypothetical protein